MIPQPWRCIEREKTPAPSAVCTHPTPGSTTPEAGRSQHPQQPHTGCRNALGETPRALSSDAQFEVKCHPSSCLSSTKEIWTICFEVGTLTDTYSRQIPACELGGVESFGTRTHHSRWSGQMFCPCTCWLNLIEQSEKIVWVAGNKFCLLAARERHELQGIIWPGGARRAELPHWRITYLLLNLGSKRLSPT